MKKQIRFSFFPGGRKPPSGKSTKSSKSDAKSISVKSDGTKQSADRTVDDIISALYENRGKKV